MIDGGVRSGADVVKLLALGAKAVGFGRTFLYANGTHGEEGVRRVIDSELHILVSLNVDDKQNYAWLMDCTFSSPRRNCQYYAQYRCFHNQRPEA